MGTQQQYVATIKAPQVSIATANAARDGTGTLGTLHTAGGSGARFDQLELKATVTTTAGCIRLFRSTDGGTTKRLYREYPNAAVTVSATQPAWSQTIRDLGLVLAPGEIIYASTEKAENHNVFLSEGGDI